MTISTICHEQFEMEPQCIRKDIVKNNLDGFNTSDDFYEFLLSDFAMIFKT